MIILFNVNKYMAEVEVDQDIIVKILYWLAGIGFCLPSLLLFPFRQHQPFSCPLAPPAPTKGCTSPHPIPSRLFRSLFEMHLESFA